MKVLNFQLLHGEKWFDFFPALSQLLVPFTGFYILQQTHGLTYSSSSSSSSLSLFLPLSLLCHLSVLFKTALCARLQSPQVKTKHFKRL